MFSLLVWLALVSAVTTVWWWATSRSMEQQPVLVPVEVDDQEVGN